MIGKFSFLNLLGIMFARQSVDFTEEGFGQEISSQLIDLKTSTSRESKYYHVRSRLGPIKNERN